MHSERILIFEPPESKLRKAGVGHGGGVMVALKRRFNNVWVDEEKQLQLDTFLGLRHAELFSSANLYYKVRSSGPGKGLQCTFRRDSLHPVHAISDYICSQYAQEDAIIPLDSPESDDETDPVGQISWPRPDKASIDASAQSG